MIFRVGINNMNSSNESYTVWHSMLRRCYSSVYQKGKPTYVDCKVSNEWLLHSNFNSWFKDNYIEGWQLDKDLLSGESKIYSQETCCFLPSVLNSLITIKKKNNDLPQGVYYKISHGKYIAQLSFCDQGMRESGHLCISSDIDYCFKVYKEAKENKIKEFAIKYKDQMKPKVFNALLNFKVTP